MPQKSEKIPVPSNEPKKQNKKDSKKQEIDDKDLESPSLALDEGDIAILKTYVSFEI